MSNEEDTFEDLKYLLGNMGIEIFLAIDKGARDFETIKIFSGLPIACIRGRVPVLLDLSLIKNSEENYFLTEKGNHFKRFLYK